jgi:hypothetical protein
VGRCFDRANPGRKAVLFLRQSPSAKLLNKPYCQSVCGVLTLCWQALIVGLFSELRDGEAQMEDVAIEEKFLHYLYTKNYGEGDPTLDAIDNWVKTKGLNRVNFWDEYDRLIKRSLLRYKQDEGTVRLTPQGTLYAEKHGFSPPQLVRTHRDMRSRLLHTLAIHLVKIGPNITMDDLVDRAGLEGNYCLGNIELLVALGYARWIIPQVRLDICSKVCAKDAVLSHAT